MIKTFRHRGLERFFTTGDGRGLQPGQLVRVRRLLGILDAAETVETLQLFPDMRLHAPKGARTGVWAISNSRMWQINFSIEDRDVCEVNLVRYY